MSAPRFDYAAFDLDGTLLDEDGTIAERTVTGLRGLRTAGVALFVVSGRSPSLVRLLGLAPRVLALFEPVMVLRDGDITWHWRTDTVATMRTLPAEVVPTLTAHFPDLVVDTGEGLVASSRRAAMGHAAFFGCPRSSIGVAGGPPAAPAAKVTIYAEPTEVRATLRGLHGYTFDAASEGKRCSVVPEGSCKTVGLADVLARHYDGATLASVVAFGDGPNDACLLGHAGAGVAMAVADPDTAGQATIQLTGSLAEYLTESFPAGLDRTRGSTTGVCRHGRSPATAGGDQPAAPAG
jgi:hydroxymethylpyrimidine pyrophosphatase-like HAD family hydrolase